MRISRFNNTVSLQISHIIVKLTKYFPLHIIKNDHMYKFYRVGTIFSTWVFHVPYLSDFRISLRIFQEFPFIKSLSGDLLKIVKSGCLSVRLIVCLSAYLSALQNFYFIDLVNSLENYDTSQSCLIYNL